ncbi:DoxX family membrane protein [Myxococcaceae bacterium GXIMD 01537]
MKGQSLSNAQLAHGLARLGLGLNIALHGLVRLPNLGGFAAGMRDSFAQSPLPPVLVHAVSYGIPVAEAVIGVLLLLGLQARLALIAGTCLMLLLITGSCLSQNWSAAGIQMTYLGFYAVLLATLHHDGLSLASWRKEAAK